MKYVVAVSLIALIAVAITLFGASIASLMQTISAFQEFADPTIIFLGIPIGVYLPVIYGVMFQYGQNAALYIREHYGSDEEIATVFRVKLTSNNISLGVFIACLTVDVATNFLWFYKSVAMTGDLFVDVLIQVVGYGSMFLIAWSEEVLGIVVQALRRVSKQLSSIKLREKAQPIIAQNRAVPQSELVARQLKADQERRRQEQLEVNRETRDSHFAPKLRPAPVSQSESTYHPIGMTAISRSEKYDS